VTGSDVIVDGDMEAVGVAAWGVEGLEVLTKDVADPYSGARCLQVAKTQQKLFDNDQTPLATTTVKLASPAGTAIRLHWGTVISMTSCATGR